MHPHNSYYDQPHLNFNGWRRFFLMRRETTKETASRRVQHAIAIGSGQRKTPFFLDPNMAKQLSNSMSHLRADCPDSPDYRPYCFCPLASKRMSSGTVMKGRSISVAILFSTRNTNASTVATAMKSPSLTISPAREVK